MTTETSYAFQAMLPGNLSESALESMKRWGRETCEGFSLETCGDATAIVAIRDTQKTVRGFQTLLLTNLKHWGIDIPAKRRMGWLSLLTVDEAKETLAHHAPQTKPCNDEFHPIALKLPVNLLRIR